MSTAAVMEHDYPVEMPEPHHESQEQSLEERKDVPSIWRSLLQLRLLLPYVAKILPMLEGNLSTALAPLTQPRQDLAETSNRSLGEVSKGFLDLQAGHREIRSHVQEQAIQLKRIDDQLIRLRESTERNTMEHQELVEDLRSASKLVRTLSTIMIVMMVVVTIMVGFMLMHWRH